MFIKQILHHLNSRDTKLIPKISTKLKATIFLVIISSAIIFTKFSFAQNLIKDKQAAIAKGNNQESWLNEALTSNLMSLQIMLSGTIPETILNGDYSSLSYYKPGGVFGTTNQLIAYTFTQPISGVEYIAQVKDNFLGKPVYAQGYGFNSLNKGILPLWKIFRNTVYSLFSIIFVVIGIMLMLRVKISPQAVITIQNSIPKIITTLILVTFSYAIAGLCIDLMNFILAFVVSLLFAGTEKTGGNLFNPKGLSQWLQEKVDIISFDFKGLNNPSIFTFSAIVQRMVPSSTIALIGASLGGLFGLLTGPVTGALGAVGGALIVTVAISVLLLFNIISFLFGLVKAYITILLQIIFAPFEIAMGAFPNSKTGFSTWATKLIGNLAVFPISLLFLYIVNILIDFVGKDLWTPVILNNSGGILGIDFFMPTMVGIGAIFLLPKLPSMIPEFIFMIKPSPWGKAIGEGYSSSFIGAGTRALSKGSQEASASFVTNLEKKYVGTAKTAYTQTFDDSIIGKEAGKEATAKKARQADRRAKKNGDAPTSSA